MAITQKQRILDLALAGLDANQIAHALATDEPTVTTALADLTATPSTQGGKATTSSTYTLTYNTAARTVPAATAVSVVTTASTQTSPWGFGSQAQADAIPVAINAVEADVLALKQVVVGVVKDLQTAGIVN